MLIIIITYYNFIQIYLINLLFEMQNILVEYAFDISFYTFEVLFVVVKHFISF
jgi:hypothetical protein